HAQLAGVAIRWCAGDLNDVHAAGLAEGVPGGTGPQFHVGHPHLPGQHDQDDEQERAGEQSGATASHAGSLLVACEYPRTDRLSPGRTPTVGGRPARRVRLVTCPTCPLAFRYPEALRIRTTPPRCSDSSDSYSSCSPARAK